MSWIDGAILVILVLGALHGRAQGLVLAIVPLFAVIAATVAAGVLYDRFADSISTIVTDDGDALRVGFLAIFGAVYLGGELVAAISGSVVSLLSFGQLTRSSGMALGLLKGALLVDTLLLFLVTMPWLGTEGALADSALAPLFIDTLPVMRFLLPLEFDDAAAAF